MLPNGDAILVWGEAHTVRAARVRSTPSGYQFLPTETLYTGRRELTVESVELVVDAQGRMTVAWTTSPGAYRAYSRRDLGAGWSEPESLGDSIADLHLALDPESNVVMITSSSIHAVSIQRVAADGLAWSSSAATGLVLNDTEYLRANAAVAFDAERRAVVFARRPDGSLYSATCN
jgi:hypothetical protein